MSSALFFEVLLNPARNVTTQGLHLSPFGESVARIILILTEDTFVRGVAESLASAIRTVQNPTY
jgi:hypothetical protein